MAADLLFSIRTLIFLRQIFGVPQNNKHGVQILHMIDRLRYTSIDGGATVTVGDSVGDKIIQI